jgi:hypothetical protein
MHVPMDGAVSGNHGVITVYRWQIGVNGEDELTFCGCIINDILLSLSHLFFSTTFPCCDCDCCRLQEVKFGAQLSGISSNVSVLNLRLLCLLIALHMHIRIHICDYIVISIEAADSFNSVPCDSFLHVDFA